MKSQRRIFTPEQKVALFRLHLLEKKPVSEICEEHDLVVNLFYQWQAAFFKNGAAAIEKTGKARQRAHDAKDKKIAALVKKFAKKHEVLSEVMENQVRRKKELGEI